MTTAHRPTWFAAAGKGNEGGYQTYGLASASYSSRDLPAHTTLKTRKKGQGTVDEVTARDLKADLERREAAHFAKVAAEGGAGGDSAGLLEDATKASAAGAGGGGDAAGGDAELALFDDRDDSDSSDDSSDDSGDSSDEDSDDEAELMRELEKIKAEKEAERLRLAAEQEEAERKAKEAAALTGNPLLATAVTGKKSAKLKRRWDDDVVFRNQAKVEDRSKRKRMINDTIRNDFHRRFLSRYIS